MIPGRGAGGRRLTFGAAALLSLAAWACREIPAVGGSPAAPAAPGPTAVAAAPTPAPIAVSDIPAEAEAFQEIRRQMAAHLSPGADVS
ncbi:MAG TPA: hypothetical protein VMQ61_18855, partial [Thermoanaerobaculia bacterium]|nr:hypothetical protein [Thermoanaerobaculia bacterium]